MRRIHNCFEYCKEVWLPYKIEYRSLRSLEGSCSKKLVPVDLTGIQHFQHKSLHRMTQEHNWQKNKHQIIEGYLANKTLTSLRCLVRILAGMNKHHTHKPHYFHIDHRYGTLELVDNYDRHLPSQVRTYKLTFLIFHHSCTKLWHRKCFPSTKIMKAHTAVESYKSKLTVMQDTSTSVHT